MRTASQVPAFTPLARYSPEHASALVAPAVAVVLPTGHAWQLGVSTMELPPAEKVPMLHSVQLAPPVPALQTRTAKQWWVGWSFCAGAWKANHAGMALEFRHRKDCACQANEYMACILQTVRAAATAGGHVYWRPSASVQLTPVAPTHQSMLLHLSHQLKA